MTIAVFGATGRSGIPFLRRAVEAGHSVRAAVRSPEKLGELQQHVTPVPGDVLNGDDVERSVAGADAVVSLIGPSKDAPRDMLTQAGENLIRAMEKTGVERLIILTGAGVRFPGDEPTLLDRFIRALLKTLQPQLLNDSEGYVERVRRSALRWTVVRGPMLHQKPADGEYRVGTVGSGVGPRASRDQIARFILDELKRDQYVGRGPVVSD